MAIYNAYADRVPVYVLLGNIADVAFRRSDVEWTHAVQDAAAMVRDYTKWDDAPVTLGHFAESAVRAYKIAMTPPYAPVVIVADAVMQEEGIPAADRGRLRVPKRSVTTPPAADAGAVAEVARMLVAADSPVIMAGRAARTPKGIARSRRARRTGAGAGERWAPVHAADEFPDAASAAGAGVVATADLLLALEIPDLFQATHASTP
jgi:thiamine pyrophosphate-dependent acetolactate synthase large subunit-like protein